MAKETCTGSRNQNRLLFTKIKTSCFSSHLFLPSTKKQYIYLWIKTTPKYSRGTLQFLTHYNSVASINFIISVASVATSLLAVCGEPDRLCIC